MKPSVQSIEKLFSDKSLFKKALTLANGTHAAAYEQLEFLGDRVLGLLIADMLYHQFPTEKEGEWAIRFTDLVKEETLAEISRILGLPSVLITHEDALRQNNSILSDVCEALLGALYLDRGLDIVKTLITPLWEPFLTKESIKDPKSLLQEWSQQHVKEMPTYTVLTQAGPDHDPIFAVKVKVKCLGEAIGHGHSKKEAMRNAAKLLLQICPPQNKKHKKK